MVEKICKVLQPTPRPAPQYPLTPKYKPAPPHPPPLWYYPPQLGVMYQQPPLPGLQGTLTLDQIVKWDANNYIGSLNGKPRCSHIEPRV